MSNEKLLFLYVSITKFLQYHVLHEESSALFRSGSKYSCLKCFLLLSQTILLCYTANHIRVLKVTLDVQRLHSSLEPVLYIVRMDTCAYALLYLSGEGGA